MTFEGLRGYAQAANDLSAIARARLLEAVREAVRAEVERAGVAVGLASAEEVAALKRSVDRLQRRVALLEGAPQGAGPASSTSDAGGSDTSSRPARRPSAARARATSRGGVGGRPPAGAPHSTRPPAPAGPPAAPDAPAPETSASTTTTDAAGATAPQRRPSARATSRRRPTAAQARADAAASAASPQDEPASSSGPAPSEPSSTVTPVRRPRKAAAEQTGAAAGAGADGGQNSGGRP
ncbi:hypothetical protein [Quadrisphaera setariae]|uniref:Polyhydroxyalkanoate synthesis regulator phasin n=1 Tax=Quadrisphaera setariae TaxID=2593304 RepID=A0A5C8Z104_9ACTN|nr:hypothetical protein [Quadrisphaera setariae]TXR51755.1 hypothetical protein FMM08_21050 [Quadrisphaera setariae]